MDGFSFYKIYTPLHLHFTTKYDCLKYNNRSSAINMDAYQKKKEASIFESWGARYVSSKKAGKLCLSNHVYGDSGWLFGSKTEAETVLDIWNARISNLNTVIKNEISTLKTMMYDKSLNLNMILSNTPSGNKPPLLQILLMDDSPIHWETAIFIDKSSPFLSDWNNKYSTDPYISGRLNTIQKYIPFISIQQINFDLLKELQA